MTEQEAQVWAARLIQIWGVDAVISSENRGGGEYWFQLQLQPHIVLSCFFARSSSGASFRLADSSYEPNEFWLTLTQMRGSKVRSLITGLPRILPKQVTQQELEEAFSAFVAQYLPYFRRSCWLSGCSIEASAHEKAEWIREFTREEIEAWNLKI